MNLTPSQQRELDKIVAEHETDEQKVRLLEQDDETGTVMVGAGPHRWGIGKRGGVTPMPDEPPESGANDTASSRGALAPHGGEPDPIAPDSGEQPELGSDPAPSNEVAKEEPQPQPAPTLEGSAPPPPAASARPVETSGAEVATDPSIDPELYKPDPAELIVRDSDDIYRAMDRADEMMILDELQGRALESMLYSFEVGGKRTTDLTVAGVNETVRLMNERGRTKIGIAGDTPPQVSEISEPDETGELRPVVRVMVFARDSRHPDSGIWGVATQPKTFVPTRGKNAGKTVWDQYALTKALNKAQRNAKKMMIPEDFRQHLIAMFLSQGKVQKLEPARVGGQPETANLPEPVSGPEADKLVAECKGAYDELKEVNRLAMQPGAFHVYLERARGSIEGLTAFRDRLRAQVDHERAEAQKVPADA